MKKVLSLIACIGLSLALNAQNKKVFGTKDGELIHESSESYEWPTDAKVLEKLDKWQDVKFGIMYHWGIYSVPGITESWLLCSEDRFTKRRQRVAPDKPYDEFKKWYWGLADSFNPVKFEPSVGRILRKKPDANTSSLLPSIMTASVCTIPNIRIMASQKDHTRTVNMQMSPSTCLMLSVRKAS